MHHMMLRPERGLEVDHVNRNKLDNRRENLRLVTRRDNILNSDNPIARRMRGEPTEQQVTITLTGYAPVVYWCRSYRKWRAYLALPAGKRKYVGSGTRKLELLARFEIVASDMKGA